MINEGQRFHTSYDNDFKTPETFEKPKDTVFLDYA